MVTGGASGIDVNRISELGDRTSEGQAAGVYGASFTVGSLASVGARCGMREFNIRDLEFMYLKSIKSPPMSVP